MKAFLDTHAAVALFEGEPSVFGKTAVHLIEDSALFVSPIVELELGFLKEIGRFQAEPLTILKALREDWGVGLADDPISVIIAQAMKLSWTRDPFDRLLVATAILHRSPLITRDRKIHQHFSEAVW